jgi:8-oxo-dGTP pyrophosphatase MutT (NUDIX family)
MSRITRELVQKALTLPDFDSTVAQMRLAPIGRPTVRADRPHGPKLAAVLILLYPSGDPPELTFALMRRNEYPGAHSGQISLPGGSAEPGESWEQTAIRETCEEFGVCSGIEVLGALTPIYVPPSDFEIHPIVGALTEVPTFQPNAREVAYIVEVPLRELFDENAVQHEDRVLADGRTMRVPYFTLRGNQVWGATAIILSEFEARLRAAELT